MKLKQILEAKYHDQGPASIEEIIRDTFFRLTEQGMDEEDAEIQVGDEAYSALDDIINEASYHNQATIKKVIEDNFIDLIKSGMSRTDTEDQIREEIENALGTLVDRGL